MSKTKAQLKEEALAKELEELKAQFVSWTNVYVGRRLGFPWFTQIENTGVGAILLTEIASFQANHIEEQMQLPIGSRHDEEMKILPAWVKLKVWFKQGDSMLELSLSKDEFEYFLERMEDLAQGVQHNES